MRPNRSTAELPKPFPHSYMRVRGPNAFEHRKAFVTQLCVVTNDLRHSVHWGRFAYEECDLFQRRLQFATRCAKELRTLSELRHFTIARLAILKCESVCGWRASSKVRRGHGVRVQVGKAIFEFLRWRESRLHALEEHLPGRWCVDLVRHAPVSQNVSDSAFQILAWQSL